MIRIITKVRGGRVEVDVPEDWPEGAEVEIHPRDAGTKTSDEAPRMTSADDWRRQILETAGKWQGEFVRPDQGEYERRESLS